MKIQLEYAEWANFWFEDAPNQTADRIMLIGDSITNGYRRIVQEKFKSDGYLIDMAIGSRGVDNPSLYAEIEYAIGSTNSYKYKLIHFNNGLHAKHLTADEYEKGLRYCINLIKKLQPEAIMVLATSTSISDDIQNDFVKERNKIVKQLAAEFDLIVNDLFNAVYKNPDFPQSDGVHFKPEGCNRIADIVYGIIAQNMKK